MVGCCELLKLEGKYLLDPMHIENNVCVSLMGFLWGDSDTKNVREDCKENKVHIKYGMKSEEEKLPPAPWVLPKEVLKEINHLLSTVRFPTSYGAKLKSSCQGGSAQLPTGLKLHDYYKLMQHLLPLALCSCAGKSRPTLCKVIYGLSDIFR